MRLADDINIYAYIDGNPGDCILDKANGDSFMSESEASAGIVVTSEMRRAGMGIYEDWRAGGGEEDGMTGKLSAAI